MNAPTNYRIYMDDEPLDVADNHFDSYAEALRTLDKLHRADPGEPTPILNGSYVTLNPIYPELTTTIHIDTPEPS